GPAERFGDPGGPAARRGRVAQRAHRRCVSEQRRPQQRRWAAWAPKVRSASLAAPRPLACLSGLARASRLIVGIEVAEVHAVLSKRRLGLRETPAKSLARDPQGILWIDLEAAGERNHRKQEVAHLLKSLSHARCPGQLARLLGDGF